MSKILWEEGDARRMGRRREGREEDGKKEGGEARRMERRREGREEDGKKEGGKVKERENEIKLTCTLHFGHPWTLATQHTHFTHATPTSHEFLGPGCSCEYSTSRKKNGDAHNVSCAWSGGRDQW